MDETFEQWWLKYTSTPYTYTDAYMKIAAQAAWNARNAKIKELEAEIKYLELPNTYKQE